MIHYQSTHHEFINSKARSEEGIKSRVLIIAGPGRVDEFALGLETPILVHNDPPTEKSLLVLSRVGFLSTQWDYDNQRNKINLIINIISS